jgi:hypothetical protein
VNEATAKIRGLMEDDSRKNCKQKSCNTLCRFKNVFCALFYKDRAKSPIPRSFREYSTGKNQEFNEADNEI